MKTLNQEKSKTLRKDRNEDLLKRMQAGEPISQFNSQSSWFPPRPIIEKDDQAVQKLYGAEQKPTLNTITTAKVEVEQSRQGPKPLRLA